MEVSHLHITLTTDGSLRTFLRRDSRLVNELLCAAAQAVQEVVSDLYPGIRIGMISTVNPAGGETTDAILFEGKEYTVVGGKAQPGSAMLSATWSLWQLGPLVVLSAAGMATPQAEVGTAWEGRQVDLHSIDSTALGGRGRILASAYCRS